MSLYAFGPFVFDTVRQSLTRDGRLVPVEGNATEILRRLLEARGGTVERAALLAQLWGDARADDRALSAAVAHLNRTLEGDVIETVPSGYRLAVPVRLLPPAWWVAERQVPPRWHRFVKPALAAIPLLIALGLVALYLDQRWEAEARRLPPASLAIRPFAADPGSHLGLGLADALTRQLGAQPRLVLRPTRERTPADYVLDGAIRREAGRLSITATLTHVANSERRWSERFEEAEPGAFRLQQGLAARVARSLVPRFGAEDEAALETPAPRLAEAWALQIEARGNLAEPELAPEAVAMFRQAIQLDPGYAAAYAGLASALTRLARGEDDRRRAREAATRALALDDRNTEALLVLGDLDFFHAWDWKSAGTAYHRAAALDPNSVEAMEAHGWFLAAMGRHVEAMSVLGRAHRLDPRRLRSLEHLGAVHWMAGQPEAALTALDEAAATDSKASRPHLLRLLLLDQLGRFDEAMAARRIWLALAGAGELGDRLARLHDSDGYAAAMAEWNRFLDRVGAPYEAALQWMAIGEREPALAALERCVEMRCASAPFLLQHPPLLPLHRVPRFQALAARLARD
ncbi:MAG: hypothetical protein FJX60_09145 [Alphaproteobacteria bacterium]|nr:hypothetical protein [Alphaproteobacteria bacterium]